MEKDKNRSDVPVLVHVAGDHLRLPLVLDPRHRLLLLLVEELVHWARLHLLPACHICLRAVLLCLHVFGAAHLRTFAQQRVILFLDVHAVAFFVV